MSRPEPSPDPPRPGATAVLPEGAGSPGETSLSRAALEEVDVGVMACDGDGRLTIFNRAARDLFGVPRDAPLDAPLEEYFDLYLSDGTTRLHPEEMPHRKALVGTSLDGEELMIASSRGWARTISVTARLLAGSDGVPIGAITTIRDITEQSRVERDLRSELERALESDRLKRSFLANMSHEIRTPLNIILGYNQMIADYFEEHEETEQLSLIEAISRASRRLMNTVHGILDISRIEVGAFETQPVPLKPAALIQKQIEDFRVAARDKNITLTSEIDEPDATILCDEHCFTQALTNLLDNAIKFTEEGFVCTRLFRNEDDVLCLEVRDTGIGIDAEYLPHLFEPFSQAETGYTRRFEGSGLGLALVRSYLEFNEADVGVESVKGKGSTFRIHFHREVGHAKPHGETSAAADQELPKPLVLVVEDDLETQGYMEALLSRQYRVALAASGEEFRQRLAEHGNDIQLILMDLSLKGEEDGLQLTRNLREHPTFKNVAVIATTAHAFLEDQNRALSAGCDAFLAKPFGREELFATMDKFL